MADSLGTNPIVVDLTNTTDRAISSGTIFVTNIVISGLSPDNGASSERIHDGSASGARRFAYRKAAVVGGEEVAEGFSLYAPIRNPFYNSATGTWQAGSVMLIYHR